MTMKTKQSKVRIELTPEQQEQVRQATGKSAAVLELTAEELEERVAPTTLAVTDGTSNTLSIGER